MNIKQMKGVVGVGIVLAVLAIGFFVATPNNQAVIEAPRQESTQAENVLLSIEGIYAGKSVLMISEETVLSMLERLNAEEPKLQLSIKEYPGLGALVEGMNGKRNGTDDKYWQYKVNGVMPQVGADKLVLHDGDTVEWYFGRSEF